MRRRSCSSRSDVFLYYLNASSDINKINKSDVSESLQTIAVSANDKYGIAATAMQLFYHNFTTQEIIELNRSDYSDIQVVSTSSFGGGAVFGIGAIKDRLYAISIETGAVYELDTETLANLSGAGVTLPSNYVGGIGGTTNRLYYHGRGTIPAIDNRKIYELDPETLANLSGAGVESPASSNPMGIGGDKFKLWCINNGYPTATDNRVYEVDPETLANLSGSGATPPDSSTYYAYDLEGSK